jgi:hypothetical protein
LNFSSGQFTITCEIFWTQFTINALGNTLTVLGIEQTQWLATSEFTPGIHLLHVLLDCANVHLLAP